MIQKNNQPEGDLIIWEVYNQLKANGAFDEIDG
jgi:hypothetical protein